MHSGLEVVLPTGEVVRTGMGALPANNTWQTFPYGFGPYLDGMFSQSNLGIVTKMGMTLMPAPPDYESFMYTFAKEDDLAQIVEIIRPLRISMILENAAQLRSAEQTLAVQGAPRTDFWTGKGRIPTEVVEAETAKLPCGKCAWIYYGMAYGPQHIRKYKLDIIDAEFNKVPGCKKIDPATIPEDNYFWSRDKIARGETDLEELLWCNWVPNGSHIAFSPVSPIRGKDARALYALARRMQEENNIDAMFPAFIVGLREMHLIVEIVFNKHDPEDSANALKAMRGMVDEAARLGYGEYRTHLALMDQVAGTYCWNDNAIMKLNERIKDALDPRGILAPGKSGVWPERYRGRGWEMDIGREERSEGHGVAHGGSEARL